MHKKKSISHAGSAGFEVGEGKDKVFYDQEPQGENRQPLFVRSIINCTSVILLK